MAEVKVDVGNIRQYLPEIRQMAEGKALRAVSKPGVRTEINYELYKEMKDTLPVDTGAFQDSPITPSPVIHFKRDEHDLPRKPYRYANGDITDDGIVFDPYEIDKDGWENHYAGYIPGLHLTARVLASSRRKKNAIAQVIIKEMNDGDN